VDSLAASIDPSLPCILDGQCYGGRGQPCAAAVVLAIGMLTSTASAQWTVTNLHPAGATESRAHGVSGGQQVGYAAIDGHIRASLWSGTAASWVDLTPDGATASMAEDVSDGQQVGWVFVGGQKRASLWHGTAASWVDLHPAGSAESHAYGVGDGEQVGYARLGGQTRACLWRGTAASWTDLHEPGPPDFSVAFGVDNGQQVGSVRAADGLDRARLWKFPTANWIDLTVGLTSSSLSDVSDGEQVGYFFVGGTWRASLWRGTIPSWVDLHPVGTNWSFARAVDRGQQVGRVHIGPYDRASLWSGSAASWVNLHHFTPSDFLESVATGISRDDNFIYVVGYGYNGVSARYEALLWSQGLPGACCSAANGCQDGVIPDICVAGGGTSSGSNSLCLGDPDGDGVDEVCDECPGVDDAIFAPGCAGAIPAASSWGLVALALALLCLAKAHGLQRELA